MTPFSRIALAALALATVATPALAQTAPQAVIVVVDMDRVINSSAAGKIAAGELKVKLDAIQARVGSLRSQFGNEEQALLKTRPSAAGAAATAWEAKVRDLQNRRQSAEADLQVRSKEFQSARDSVAKQINDAAMPILTALMRERGANLVLPQAATLQSSGTLSITADAIARLDRALPRVSTATPPK